MPSLPRKARNGDDFKSYTTSAINKLIDYLHSMRPKDSPDIKVKESASGVMFELANRPAKTPQVISVGGGGASGLVATVSGGTASVAVSGSSPLVIKAGQNVTITGGTNGEVIIGSTASSGGGMGFPDWNHSVVNISPGTAYSYPEDSWLAGSVETSGIDMGRTIIYVMVNGIYFDLFKIPSDADGFYQQNSHVCIPIPANTTVSLGTYSGIYTGVTSGLKLYATL